MTEQTISSGMRFGKTNWCKMMVEYALRCQPEKAVVDSALTKNQGETMKTIAEVVAPYKNGTKFVDGKDNRYQLDKDGDLEQIGGDSIFPRADFTLIGISGLRKLEESVDVKREVYINVHKHPLTDEYSYMLYNMASNAVLSQGRFPGFVAMIVKCLEWKEKC